MDERAGAGGADCSGLGSCSCGSDTALLVDAFDAPRIPGWVSGMVRTPVGIAPLVKTTLSRSDVIGSWKARWGIGRMNYRVTPGLYGVGAPDEDSPVLVSANYKMSFDRLRRALAGIDAWILVLDTKGINVWCAAGKGTFGTREIVERIARFRLFDVVRHRMLIVPQLGAPGVEAHEVKKQTGFRVVYGPVRADDLPAFIAAHGKATPAMRTVRFDLIDRLVLTPMELVAAIKPALILIACLFLVKLIGSPRDPFLTLLAGALIGFLPFLGAVVMGSIAAPALLPYVPVQGLCVEGMAPRAPLGGLLRIFRIRPDALGGGPLLPSCAAADLRVSGHELHRRLDIHLPFGRGARDEDGPSGPHRIRRSGHGVAHRRADRQGLFRITHRGGERCFTGT